MPPRGWKPSAESTAKWRKSMDRHRLPTRDRFMQKVEFDAIGGCWLWAGTIIKQTGYGQIEVCGSAIGAHRLAYTLFKGDIPTGQHVCHRCDVRACVNPGHLFVASHVENMADMVRKGRAASLKGSAGHAAKITEADVPKILARLLIGHTCAEIATDYGVTDCAINAIRRGKSWNHVTGLPRVRSKFHDGQGSGGANNLAREAA